MAKDFKEGDPVIYRRQKHSYHPGPRAEDIHPEYMGEGYRYVVDKFWVVDHIDEDGTLTLRTRTGKTHTIAPDDPRLRRPSMWERLRYRRKFPSR